MSTDDHQLLLEDSLPQNENSEQYAGDGSVDLKGNPVLKSKTGNWKTCPFILGTECCERLAYYGIAKNLVNYLTGKLHEGNVSAARNVNTWAGTCYLTPLLGAFLADAYWGRYWTIAVFSTIYFIGMCTLALSASVPAFKPPVCVGSICPSATPLQNAVFFIGLYLIALGTGGIKPCVSSFGADQFDDTDPRERVKKGSFFNWFYFSINIGSLVSSTIVVWIQENVGWDVGFGIPAVFMGLAIASFFSGTALYRLQRPAGSPLTRMCQVIVASLQKHALEIPQDSTLLYESPDKLSTIGGSRKLEHTEDLKDCPTATQVWDGFVLPVTFYDLNSEQWLKANLENTNETRGMPWNIAFTFICWFIWKKRNSWVFRLKNISSSQCRTQAMNAAWEFLTNLPQPCSSSNGGTTSGENTNLHWQPPSYPFLHFNVDASWQANSHCSGIGGVLRDGNGSWKGGFQQHCIMETSEIAELMAIRTALTIISQHQLNSVIVLSDCKMMVDLINDKNVLTHDYIHMILDCRELLEQSLGCHLRFTSRKINEVADTLAKKAVEHAQMGLPYEWLPSPPYYCMETFLRDYSYVNSSVEENMNSG